MFWAGINESHYCPLQKIKKNSLVTLRVTSAKWMLYCATFSVKTAEATCRYSLPAIWKCPYHAPNVYIYILTYNHMGHDSFSRSINDHRATVLHSCRSLVELHHLPCKSAIVYKAVRVNYTILSAMQVCMGLKNDHVRWAGGVGCVHSLRVFTDVRYKDRLVVPENQTSDHIHSANPALVWGVIAGWSNWAAAHIRSHMGLYRDSWLHLSSMS